MKIEVIEFYIEKNDPKAKKWKGTCHIYLIDHKMDIRGIKVFKNKNYIYVELPHLTSVDPKTKERVRYPLINFIEADDFLSVRKAIRDEAIKYFKQDLFLSKEKPEN
jgi:hypothetical protein